VPAGALPPVPWAFPLTMNKILLGALCLAVAGRLAAEPVFPPGTVGPGGPAAAAPAEAAPLPQISVQGNRFVDPSGHPVLFRGLSIADPDRLADDHRWNRDLFVAAQGMGANLVRLPVHPAAWRKRGKEAYLKLLDQAVGWSRDLNLYVIIDWHSIGNLQTEMFQDTMYNTSRQETFDFWRTIAAHFKGNSTVAFYELFNEPTHFGGQLGTMSWTEWKSLNTEMIGIIRFSDPKTVELVAGFDWAYDLTAMHYDPLTVPGIGFVTHPYPFKRSQPWEPRWEEDFAFVADKYPMIATEIGYETPKGHETDPDRYPERITTFLEARGISWVAWVFDPEWWPQLLKKWDGFELTREGQAFKAALHRPPTPLLAKPQ
jgi:endoglucanase